MDTWTRGLDFPRMAQRTSSDTHGNDPSGGPAHCPSVPTLESLLSRSQEQLPFLPISLPEHSLSPVLCLLAFGFVYQPTGSDQKSM